MLREILGLAHDLKGTFGNNSMFCQVGTRFERASDVRYGQGGPYIKQTLDMLKGMLEKE